MTTNETPDARAPVVSSQAGERREAIAQALWIRRGGKSYSFLNNLQRLRNEPESDLYPPFRDCLLDADAVIAAITPAPGGMEPADELLKALVTAYRRFGGIRALACSEHGPERIIEIATAEAEAIFLRTAAGRERTIEPAAWGRIIDGKAVTVSLVPTNANNEPLYASTFADEWQSIETAPKDKTPIIVCGDYSDDVAIVRWDERKRDWLCLADGLAVVEHEGDWGTDYLYFSVPSHWQPCPKSRRSLAQTGVKR